MRLPSLLHPGHGTTPSQRTSTLFYDRYENLEVIIQWDNVTGEATLGEAPARGIRMGAIAPDVSLPASRTPTATASMLIDNCFGCRLEPRMTLIVVADEETWLLSTSKTGHQPFYGNAQLGSSSLRHHRLAHFMLSITEFLVRGSTHSLLQMLA